MKALSLWQPWASLVINGIKLYETRSWPCPKSVLGQRLAIHAAKVEVSAMSGADHRRDELMLEAMREAQRGASAPMPRGAVLGIVRFVECYPTDQANRQFVLSKFENALGDFTPGRFAWRIQVIERFETPIPAKGMQGIWEWDREAAGTGAAYADGEAARS